MVTTGGLFHFMVNTGGLSDFMVNTRGISDFMVIIGGLSHFMVIIGALSTFVIIPGVYLSLPWHSGGNLGINPRYHEKKIQVNPRNHEKIQINPRYLTQLSPSPGVDLPWWRAAASARCASLPRAPHTTQTHRKGQPDKECAWGRPRLLVKRQDWGFTLGTCTLDLMHGMLSIMWA